MLLGFVILYLVISIGIGMYAATKVHNARDYISAGRSLPLVMVLAVVLMYTLYGGMWSVALTTFFQMIVIVLGLFYIAWLISDLTGGVAPVIEHAAANNKFHFWPELNAVALVAFLSGLLTMGFGSIPQQDVFQRANASKNEHIAVWGTVLGGVAYFLFAAVPLFLAYSANLIDPVLTAKWLAEDSQKLLPELVKSHLPLAAQVIFYGALLSVIMSTASGTLLAPSVTISENVLNGFVTRLKHMSDKKLLTMTRWVVGVFSVVVTLYALWALGEETGIHQMVENAYKVTLVVAFVPLVAGLYWRRASTLGAYLAIGLGLATWIPLEILLPEGAGFMPPQFAGFLMACAGMIAGSFMGAPGVTRHPG